MKNYKMVLRSLTGGICLLLFTVPAVKAQFIEDALRLDYGMLGSSARSIGMGTAFLPIADDFSATFWNPAGLAQMRRYEISGGLRNASFSNDAFYLGNTTNFKGSSTNLDNLGIVIPVPTVQGSLTFALGYNRANDFTSMSSFEGYNLFDSIIPDLFLTRDEMSYYLFLSDSTGSTPFMGELYQNGTQEEFGSVNTWNISGGIEVIPNFFLGTTLNLISGNYRKMFVFEENDIDNMHDTFPNDFDYLFLEDKIDARISGFNALFGGLYTGSRLFSVGATIQTPTGYSIEEDYSSYGRSGFDAPDADGFSTYEDEIEGYTEYRVTTPWKFSVGTAVRITGITLSGAVDYQDWSQLEFRDAPSAVMSLNRDIRDMLQATTNYRLGAEVRLPMTDVAFRGGYIYQPSPYRGAPAEIDRKYITGGIGVTLQNSITLDLGIAHGMWESDLLLYDYDYYLADQSRWQPVTRIVNEDIAKTTVVFTFRYRF
jgi:long-subunit fatty acid transport protein